MKVILLSDVAKIGKRGDVAEVPDGYARNKLIPSGMAEPATKASLKKLEAKLAGQKAEAAVEASNFDEAAAALKETVITVPADLNEKGHAFKAVSADDIAASAKAAGIAIESNMVAMVEPIKDAGEHTVALQAGDKEAQFSIEVVKN